MGSTLSSIVWSVFFLLLFVDIQTMILENDDGKDRKGNTDTQKDGDGQFRTVEGECNKSVSLKGQSRS